MIDLARLSRAELEIMAAGGQLVRECQRVLARTGDTVLGEALRGEAPVAEWRHYPAGDVYDPETHAQYFYHAHPPGERDPDEHGHFHTFLRARGMPPGVSPLVMPELAIAGNPAAPAEPLGPSAPRPNEGEDADPWTHLVAIAMDAGGRPIRLFTTNRWVTGETWYTAADITEMLDCFVVGMAPPSWIVNRWITGMLGLFRPQIVALLHRRDAAVMSWRRRRRGKIHVLEDRRLEVTSALDVDVDAQLAQVDAALRDVA